MSLGRLANYQSATAAIGTKKDGEKLEMTKMSSSVPSTQKEDNKAKMDLFYEQVQRIKNNIEEIYTKTGEVDKLHREALTSVHEDEISATSKKIEAKIDETNSLSNSVRKTLKSIGKENKSIEHVLGESDPNCRIRSAQYAFLTNKFIAAMSQFQKTQSTYKQKYKQQIQRQYRIVRPDATDEELKQVSESADGMMMAQSMFNMGDAREEAKKALAEMQERHEDILMIEKSIIELNQLFMEMAVMVEQQGEQINQIENNVALTVDYTLKASEEMKIAVKHQKSRLKKKWAVLLCVIFILIIVGVIVFILLYNNGGVGNAKGDGTEK